MRAGRYVVRVVPFGGPATQITERAPDSVSAVCRALQRLYPGGDPHGFVATVVPAEEPEDHCAVCRCADAGLEPDDGQWPETVVSP